MPHGRVWPLSHRLSAMRRFGIIRALQGRRAARRWDDAARDVFLDWRPERAPFPSGACRAWDRDLGATPFGAFPSGSLSGTSACRFAQTGGFAMAASLG